MPNIINKILIRYLQFDLGEQTCHYNTYFNRR